jgi:two-component system, NarL family, invasion response regulator UvrY
MKTTEKFKLILADDHILLRDALKNMLNNSEEFVVIASASNGQEVIEAVQNSSRPDILLMDLNMPVMDGYATSKWLNQHHPEIKIVILTMYDSEIALIRLLQSGVHGFLKKDIHPKELKNALLAVAAGEFYYSNHTTNKIVSLFRSQSEMDKSLLSETEIEFLRLASTDLTYKEIAGKMRLTPRHIDNYRDQLFTKLEVKSRVGLVIYAIRNGLVTF